MKASIIRNQALFLLRLILLIFYSGFISISCSKDDDEKPNPVITNYDLPPEIQNNIFSGELPKEIRQVENFLNRIKEKGMAIHEGTNPPEVFNSTSSNSIGVKFNIKNDCVYDEKASSNEGTVYGKYEENIRIFKNQQNQFVVEASYSSVGDPNFPEYPTGLDRGSGTGFVSGSGNNFTYFYNVDNGVFDNIPYKALWIISGTVSGPLNAQELRNVTKCLVMKEKGEDPNDKIANPGTVRIFKDDTPERIQPDVLLTSLTPDNGVAGTPVTISGSGFSPTASSNIVRFGTTTVSATVLSATQLRVVAPSQAGLPLGGTVQVTVLVGPKTSNSLPFTYLQSDVRITSLTPNNGLAGTQVTITGSGFSTNPTQTGNTVIFGTVTIPSSAVTILSDTQLRVVAPAGPQLGGGVQVKVQVGPKTSNELPFTYPQPDVRITNLNPSSGVSGTQVTITGSGFSPTASENIVRFGTVTVPATAVTVLSATQLRVVAPNQAGLPLGGTVQVTVQVGPKTSNSLPFTYPQPDVIISDFSPVEEWCGGNITITGSGFSINPAENIVTFPNNIKVEATSASFTRLVVKVPQGTKSGPLIVQVKNKSAQTSKAFGYNGCIK